MTEAEKLVAYVESMGSVFAALLEADTVDDATSKVMGRVNVGVDTFSDKIEENINRAVRIDQDFGIVIDRLAKLDGNRGVFAKFRVYASTSALEKEDFVAYTDGVKIVVNAKYWNLMSEAQKYALLVHEIGHIANGHRTHPRRDDPVFNIAADIFINLRIDAQTRGLDLDGVAQAIGSNVCTYKGGTFTTRPYITKDENGKITSVKKPKRITYPDMTRELAETLDTNGILAWLEENATFDEAPPPPEKDDKDDPKSDEEQEGGGDGGDSQGQGGDEGDDQEQEGSSGGEGEGDEEQEDEDKDGKGGGGKDGEQPEPKDEKKEGNSSGNKKEDGKKDDAQPPKDNSKKPDVIDKGGDGKPTVNPHGDSGDETGPNPWLNDTSDMTETLEQDGLKPADHKEMEAAELNARGISINQIKDKDELPKAPRQEVNWLHQLHNAFAHAAVKLRGTTYSRYNPLSTSGLIMKGAQRRKQGGGLHVYIDCSGSMSATATGGYGYATVFEAACAQALELGKMAKRYINSPDIKYYEFGQTLYEVRNGEFRKFPNDGWENISDVYRNELRTPERHIIVVLTDGFIREDQRDKMRELAEKNPCIMVIFKRNSKGEVGAENMYETFSGCGTLINAWDLA